MFEIQVSANGETVWVHASDGSTVGRYSTRFGMDVHNTVTAQMAGASQCLNCTHTAPTVQDWKEFCRLMLAHFAIPIPDDINPHLAQASDAPEKGDSDMDVFDLTGYRPGEWGSRDGQPAIVWWRHGEAAKGESAMVTHVKMYSSDAERFEAFQAYEQRKSESEMSDSAEFPFDMARLQAILAAEGEDCDPRHVGFYADVDSLAQMVRSQKNWSQGEVFVCPLTDDRFIIMKQIAPASCEMLTITQDGYKDVLTAYRFEQGELVQQLNGYLAEVDFSREDPAPLQAS